MINWNSGWIRTGVTMAFGAAALWTGLQVSLTEIRKDREYDQRQILNNRQDIEAVQTLRRADRDEVIEMKGDIKGILRSIRRIERAMRQARRDGEIEQR